MKYCSKCGAELVDEAVVCPKCGCAVEGETPVKETTKNSGLDTAIKVFMILSCVLSGFMLIPLCWMIPMTVSACRKMREGEPISLSFKICTLLFVNQIAGILLLVRSD